MVELEIYIKDHKKVNFCYCETLKIKDILDKNQSKCLLFTLHSV